MSRRSKIILLACAAVYVLFVAFGFLFAPSIVKDIAVRKLSEALKRPVSIGEVRINPLALSATIRGLRIGEPKGGTDFVSFKELYLNLEASSILRRALVVRELRIISPYARVERTAENAYNFSDLLTGEKPKEPTNSEPLKFSVNNIRITDGRVEIFDDPKHAHHVLGDINISIPFISNFKSNVETFVQPHFYATFNGSPLVVEGRARPFVETRDTAMDISFHGIDLPEYVKYSPVAPPVVLRSGRLDIDCVLSFLQGKGDNPRLSLSGLIGLSGLAVDSRDGKRLAAIPSLKVAITNSSVYERIFRLSGITITGASVNVERDKGGRINLLSLMPAGEEPPGQPKPEAPSEPMIFSVDSILIINSGVDYKDSSFSAPYETAIKPINLEVRDLSTERGHKGSYAFSAMKDEDETIKAEGALMLDPMLTEGSFDLAGIDLTRLKPIYKGFVGIVIDHGIFGVKGRYSFVKGRAEGPANVSEVAASIDGLRLRDPAQRKPFLSVDALSILNSSADPGRQQLHIGQLSTSGGLINILRQKDGALAINALLNAPVAHPARPVAAPRSQPKPWLVDMDSMEVSGYAVNFKDLTPPGETFSVSIKNIAVGLKGFSTDHAKSATLSARARVDKRGSVYAAGSLAMSPVRLNLALRARDIGVWLAQPYVQDALSAKIGDGYLSASGRMTYNASNGAATFRGDAGISSLMLLDAERSEEVIGWKALSLKGIRASQNPNSVDIGEIVLAGLKANVEVAEDKSTNIARLMRQKAAATVPPVQPSAAAQPIANQPSPPAQPSAVQPAPPAPKWDVKIGDVVLSDGAVAVFDRSVSPSYRGSLSSIEGRVSGISSIAKEPARVDLKAMWDGRAPLIINGTLKPFKDDLHVELNLKFTNMDLSTLTPYSGTFAGYTISNGKLFVETSTKLEGKALTSQNKIMIDQFDFGDAVKSARAMHLPFKLAVALLRDRKGQINLDLPVSGSTDDPNFSYGGIIIKVIVNLITKAATSPFSLIAGAFGGEDISNVEFEPGTALLADAGQKRLAEMADVLYDRPGLKVEVKGYAGRGADEAGLKDAIFMRKLKAAKLKKLISAGSHETSHGTVTIAPEEMHEYLELAYKDEKFKKPRYFFGLAKGLPDPEMEKLMKENIEVSDDDLRELATARARAVIAFLNSTGKVEPARVFLVEGELLTPQQAGKLTPSRVEFTLK